MSPISSLAKVETTHQTSPLRPAGLALALALFALAACAAAGRESVALVGPQRIAVAAPAGTGELPVFASQDWTAPLPTVKTALLIFHGLKRNAGDYFAAAEESARLAGLKPAEVLIVAPQFLNEDDIGPRAVGSAVLRWRRSRWEGGEGALGPSALSSFEAIDAILSRLADRGVFPNLQRVVLAGHSGGGQIVQRYAVVGRGEAALRSAGVDVRYVVANPSSYLYFDRLRPAGDGFAAPSAGCAKFNDWKYGFAGAPDYVVSARAALEQAYVSREVIYLLGAADVDPDHPELDKSCAAELEGANRYIRGVNYFRYLQSRAGPSLRQRLVPIPGVAHEEAKMFHSACGLAALFGRAGCSALDGR